ncbi:hypothetical protein [Halalkalibacterium ligniniphilum]|uniref:hypothetical protein n=1 Tax=Halalkalibacterium ligniniphilum TaxID=1134413 RepID=UPI000348CA28|nr:hypothetical protein [Halalkalibacterium ligniniphilum]
MIIYSIGMKATGEMEKAMQQAHGVGYAEYERNLDKRLEVEKAREEDYNRCNEMIRELNHQS